MDINTITPLTAQQVFDAALFGIRKQEYVKSYLVGQGCAYRGQHGLKCGIGHAIPDACYNPLFDNSNLSTSIGAADAKYVSGGFTLPRMGYECDVREVRPVQWPHLPLVLTLQNMSGDYYLCSPHARIDQWPDVFGVSVTGRDKEQV